jgi:RHS repeat-associated protein
METKDWTMGRTRTAGAVTTAKYTGIQGLYARGEPVGMNLTSSVGSRGGSVCLGKDILGSVRSSSGEYGTLEDRYEYDAFGKPYKGDLDNGMNLGYTGKPYDTTTELYNYGYRDYKPEAARFTTVDPIRDGSNWFAYVNNDPVNWVDLWGLNASDKYSGYLYAGTAPELVITAPSPTPNEVTAIREGTVTRSGWQDPDNHDAGMGWRTTIDTGNGYYDQYGHLEPSSTLDPNTHVNAGDVIGIMADPTNGHSTGPHVHVETRNSLTGEPVDPGTDSPFPGGSIITSPFEAAEEGLRTQPHSGVDHIPR